MRISILTVIGVLLTIMVVFFSAGIVREKVTYETEISIEVGLDRAWSQFNDRTMMIHWLSEIENIVEISKEPGKVGSRNRITVQNNGERMVMTETVVVFEPKKRIALRTEGGQMIKQDDYYFEESNGITTVKGEHTCRGRNYIHRCMFAFFRRMFKKVDQHSLERFRDWVTQSTGVPSIEGDK